MKRFLLLLGGLTAAVSSQTPRSLDLTLGSLGAMPADWTLTTSTAWQATTVATDVAKGERALCLRRLPDQPQAIDPAGVVLRTLPTEVVAAYRNRRVTLEAELRVAGEGRAQLWLRVDRPGGRVGGFDNMHDRPITGDRWQRARIELEVDGDAERLVLGLLAHGDVVLLARDCVLTDQGPARPVQPVVAGPLDERELQNVAAATRLLGQLWFFHPSPAAVEFAAWDRFAVRLMEVARPAESVDDLCQRLLQECALLAPSVQLWVGDAAAAPPLSSPPAVGSSLWTWRHKGAGRVAKGESAYTSRVLKRRLDGPLAAAEHAANHVELELGGGVSARIPFRVVVTPGQRKAAVRASWLGAEAPKLSAHHRDTRLAAVAMAWCVFEHFYPYFDVVEVDWPGELRRALAAAAVAADDDALAVVLERLVARLQDGHGAVVWHQQPQTFLPIAVRFVGSDLVVLASKDPVLRPGDVVLSIDDRSIAAISDELRRRTSAATRGFADFLIATQLTMFASADPAILKVRRVDGSIADLRLARTSDYFHAEEPRRPAAGAELAPGIVYFDLNGAEDGALAEVLPTLTAAKGVVFDLRGYPGSAGYTLLTHLISARATSARWNVPVVTRPGREHWAWDESGRWDLRPQQPHIGGKVAFLTDGRAVSYAESVMGIVEAYQLGAIVGSATAGTNGNVNLFDLPGGFTIAWTGMRVLKHDGGRHHGVGIVPTVPAEPTVAGIAAGRDEVLERAIAVLQQQISGR
jgi:hypothetical protein